MKKILPLLLVLILFAGCISEEPYSEKKSEILLSEDIYDNNNDGEVDLYHYTYSKKEYGNYEMQREVYITPHFEISSLNFNLLDENEAMDALESFDDYSDQIKDDFDSCAEKVGIANVKCANVEYCSSKCAEASASCKKLAEKYPTLMGKLVFSLDNAMSDRISLTNSITSDLYSYGSLSASEKQQLFGDLNSLYSLGLSITQGPLFTHKETGICTSSLSYSSYTDLFSMLGIQQLKPSSYTYTVLITMYNTQEDPSKYADLFVKETLPVSIDSDSLDSAQIYTLKNKELEFSPVKSDKTSEIIYYSYESEETPSTSMFKTPQLKIRTIDLFILTPSFFIFELLLPFSNYYIAFSLAVSFPLIFFIILLNFLTLAYNLLRAKLGKKTIYNAMKGFVGVPNLAWKKDIVFGFVLFAVGIGAAFFSANVPDQTLQISKLFGYIFEDYAGLISVFCIIVGSVFFYISIQSAVKAALLQYSYAGIRKKEQEEALSEVKELSEKLNVLKKIIDECKEEGFDISEAYNVFVSIPGGKLSEITPATIERESKFVESSLHKVENVISLMKERRQNAEKNWEEWSKKMLEMIGRNREVYLSSLSFIPVSLRAWAANRFVNEHGTKGIFFEGEVIRKKEIAPEELVNQIVKSGNIINALVLKDEKPFLSIVTSGNKTVIIGLFLKLSSYLRTFMKKSHQKEYKYVMGIGNSAVLTVVKKGSLESMILCPTKKFKEGFDQWKDILDNLEQQ